MLYLKFFAQLAVTAIVALIAALTDDKIDTVEWINVALAVLGAVAVLGAGNFPDGIWRYMKLYASAATAGLMAITSFLADGGLSTSELLQVAVAVLGSLGVGVLKGPQVEPLWAAGANRRVVI